MKKLFLLWAFFSSFALANNALITHNLESLGIKSVNISDSPIAGLKTVSSEQGVMYVSNDGKYILHGTLYAVNNGKVSNVTNQALMTELNSLQKDMIIYPAVHQKYVVNIFTDITCGYCRLLHRQIKAYNNLGITVRYLAYPRSGPDSTTAEEMEAIWTSKNPNQALTDAKNGKLPTTRETPNIVAKEYALGRQFDVTGTPTIVLEDGEVIGGYLPPKELLKVLEEKANN